MNELGEDEPEWREIADMVSSSCRGDAYMDDFIAACDKQGVSKLLLRLRYIKLKRKRKSQF